MRNELKNKLFNSDLLRSLKNCIYILRDGESIVYVGKSVSIKSRIVNHFNKKADSLVVYEFENEIDMHIIEPYLISRFKPKYNKEFITKCNPSFDIDYQGLYKKRHVIS